MPHVHISAFRPPVVMETASTPDQDIEVSVFINIKKWGEKKYNGESVMTYLKCCFTSCSQVLDFSKNMSTKPRNGPLQIFQRLFSL